MDRYIGTDRDFVSKWSRELILPDGASDGRESTPGTDEYNGLTSILAVVTVIFVVL